MPKVSLADIKKATRALMEQLGLIEPGEELEALQYSLNELVCYGKDGRFAKCEKGNVYSLSTRGAKALGIDADKYVGKGKLTRDKPDEDGVYKMVSKFGQAKGSGRIALPDGEDIPPKKRVGDYPTPYSKPARKGGKGKNTSSSQKKKK